MAYYRTCPHCGCNLDPGEGCDCKNEKETAPPEPGTVSRAAGNRHTHTLSVPRFSGKVKEGFAHG